ncbi:Y-family DNA polymerase [Lacticaseibacillus nasuensis]|uniref:DNA-directed DNA polymerase n=1 Tax=Lacticaseibacillus nasuensis JCM 17158 TaxID=1291734 RepID=A0A0R1JW10_9LACO|nr:Y-family DNA polymerase [Lacticaseibacillus nasuensis]KRK72889.1 DNA-directed DNA polymerase [Lacticaseibacillus nasuensis JCM 17158]MCX2455095.1 Y-family DNA polymerase [Lacticaseibacillus nasuensis]
MSTPLDDPRRLPSHDIMCIDCKSFYASVEAIRRSEYPLAAKNAVLSRAESAGGLVLAGSPLAKANYGVRLGTRKFELRPDMDVQVVPPHMADYIKINYQINEIYRQFTDDLHWYVYSIDESFIDVTHSHSLFGSNAEIASRIQDKVFQATGIITTVGIGQNPLLAKLALDNEAKKQAPWQATWTYDRVPETIWKINELTDFWSIGSRTAIKLHNMGIYTLYDVAHTPLARLKKKFGVLGEAMYYHAWGIDYSLLERRYVPREDNKGYGNSQVLMRDYTTLEDCETVLSEIADQVATRLRKHEVQGEVVGISVGFAEPDASGQTHWGAQVHIDPTNRTDDLIRAVKYLFESKWQGDALRNVGVRVNKISHPSSFQLSLFEPSQREQANGRLEHAIDQIRSRYGYKAIVRGSSKTAGGTAIDRAGMIGGHQA